MKIDKYKIGKILIVLFLFILISQHISTLVFAKSNSNYDYETEIVEIDGENLFTSLGGVIMPVIFPLFTSLRNITSTLMYIMTGDYFFPYSDTILFNTIPLLDVNFINPSNGSLFLHNNQQTIVGEVVQKAYFTIIAMCLGLLGILVAIAAIKLAFTTIAAEKAKYKEMIASTVKTLLLIFCMHYIIAFVFFLNEEMVSIASSLMGKVLKQETIIKVVDGIQDIYDEDAAQLVENFVTKANKTAWFSPITIAKKGFKEFVNAWDSFLGFLGWGKNKDGEYENFDEYQKLDDDKSKKVREEYDEIFPSKQDVIDKLRELGDQGIYVASYLLKDYYYRDIYLWQVAGNDTNKFSKGGVVGLLTSGLNTIAWGTGIVDTGLGGLKNLYGSTNYIIKTMSATNEIDSPATYTRKSNQYIREFQDKNKSTKEKNTARINKVYIDAYFTYVYNRDDKNDVAITNVLSSLGDYFFQKSFYVDLDDGEWSPSSYDLIPSVLFCIFVLQSVMFLLAYFKRLVYVLILALIGPVAVTFDYFKKMY